MEPPVEVDGRDEACCFLPVGSFTVDGATGTTAGVPVVAAVPDFVLATCFRGALPDAAAVVAGRAPRLAAGLLVADFFVLDETVAGFSARVDRSGAGGFTCSVCPGLMVYGGAI
jgi:hypothetical protein